MQDLKIEVGGLSQLSRALRKVDGEAPKQLRLTFNDAAALLIDKARPGIPVDTGAAARSLTSRSTRTSARVAVGGKKAPYFPWLDFGGQGRKKGRPALRPFIKEGRYIYPVLRQIRPKIEQLIADGITEIVRNVGLQED